MSRIGLCMIACSLSAIAGETLAGTVSAASATAAKSSNDSSSRPATVRLTGLIEEGDADKLQDILARLQSAPGHGPVASLATIELSSHGGDLLEGIKIGNLLHQFHVATVVRKGDICLSACAMAFLGGASVRDPSLVQPDRNLEIGGKVGFHAFSLNPQAFGHVAEDGRDESIVAGFNRARGAAASVIAYAADMGIDSDFVARMLGRPTDAFEYIVTVGEFIKLAVCPLDIGRPAVTASSQATNLSNNLTTLPHVAAALQARPLTAGQVRRQLLETVQANMMAFRVRGALSDQLAAYSVMRNERATQDLYDDLRAAGLALPEIVGPTFEVTGYRAGMYDLRTIVSLSLDDPDRYDLVTIGPRGIAPASRSAPPNCRRLFLYDRQDQLNP